MELVGHEKHMGRRRGIEEERPLITNFENSRNWVVGCCKTRGVKVVGKKTGVVKCIRKGVVVEHLHRSNHHETVASPVP
ncbi:hypothetical protein HanIR_Chr02g0055391 [Helianthus annuus]|nr:hypothetical protein HanIR_Chr02g0055391 [Helianthus annuus]